MAQIAYESGVPRQGYEDGDYIGHGDVRVYGSFGYVFSDDSLLTVIPI